MFAAEIHAPRQIRLIDVPEQTLTDGQILFQPDLACLCGSDLLYFERDYPEFMPRVGHSLHEMTGRVVQTKSDRFRVGDRVLCVPVDQCGFFERYAVHANRAIGLDTRVSEAEALLAQPLGTVIFGLKKLRTVLDQDVVVLGQGPIGQLFNIALRNLGARHIIVVDPIDYRLQFGLTTGATETINPGRESLVSAIQAILDGQLADVVVEAVGHREQRLNDCFDAVRPGGEILSFGVPELTIDNVAWRKLFEKNATVHTSLGPTFDRDFPLAMRWIGERRVNVNPLITHRLPVQQIQAAFDLFAERRDGAIKVFLDFPQ